MGQHIATSSAEGDRFLAAPPIPDASSYGIWRAFTWDNHGASQYGARLLPDHAPWRVLFAALNAAGSALPGDPITPHEEADAIVACCWRYGSYAHVLATGERYPPFRADPGLARLGDDEMRRINLECSSALADWLATRAADPATIRRRVRAATRLLPTTWRARRKRRHRWTIPASPVAGHSTSGSATSPRAGRPSTGPSPTGWCRRGRVGESYRRPGGSETSADAGHDRAAPHDALPGLPEVRVRGAA